MKRALVVLGCFAFAAVLLGAQDDGFQTAKVIAFEKVANSVQHPENADSYKMSMRIGDTVYNCKGNGPVAMFNDWTTGKEVPAKVNASAKTIQVKNFDGQMIELKIAGTKKSK
jgi:hypothetical protein